MPRGERVEYENAYYHVMNRGRGRQQIYHGRVYYEAFIEGVAEANRRFGIEVHAYCLMKNHYHLLVKTPNGNLGRCMRHINGVYTQRYNRLKRTDGPLFRGRYKAILIDRDDYLSSLTRYIHRNPVETKTPWVEKLEEYPWSSYPAYLNLKSSPDWLNREETYDLLGYAQRYKGYRAYVESGIDEEIATLYGKKNHPAMIGSKRFKAQVYADMANKEIVSKLKKRETDKPGSKKIVEAVAHRLKVDELAIYHGERGKRQVARWMAMRLCQTVGGMSLSQIADAFHVNHLSGISHQISQLRQLLQTDPETDDDFQLIIQHLIP